MKDDYYKEQVSLLKVDGGASCNNLLMQIQADFLQVDLLREPFSSMSYSGYYFQETM